MGLLTKEQMLPEAAPPMVTEDVDVLGGTVRVKKWMGDEGEAFEIFISKLPPGGRLVRAAAIACSAVDESGKNVFNMNGDVEAINRTWTYDDIRKVFDVIAKLNPIGARASEDSEKN